MCCAMTFFRLTLFVSSSFSTPASAVGPWPMMLQDPAHSAQLGQSVTLSAAAPAVLWKYKARGEVEASAVVSDRAVFAAGGEEVWALDRQTGEPLWVSKVEEQVLASGALGGGLFMIGADDNTFRAFDQETGAVRWEFKAGEFTGGATVGEEEGVVYVGSSKPALHAYFLNGTRWFDFKTTKNVASTPALDATGVYFGDDGGNFFKLNRATGEKSWAVKFESNIRSPARLDADGIFIGIGDPDGSKSGEIIRLDYNGQVIWRSRCGQEARQKCGSCWTSPAVVGEVVIAGCGLDSKNIGDIWGLNKATGALRWRYKAENDCQTSSPVVVGSDAVIIGCIDSNLYAIKASDGAELWRWATPGREGIWATPALDDQGNIYVGSHDKFMYALSPQAPASDEL